MYTISNMVDIWEAKVHKRATYYVWSNMAGGKPKLNNINGFVFKHSTVQNVMSIKAPPQIFLKPLISVFYHDGKTH